MTKEEALAELSRRGANNNLCFNHDKHPDYWAKIFTEGNEEDLDQIRRALGGVVQINNRRKMYTTSHQLVFFNQDAVRVSELLMKREDFKFTYRSEFAHGIIAYARLTGK